MAGFKQCSCGQEWTTAADLVADPAVEQVRYQANPTFPEKGINIFRHTACGGMLNIVGPDLMAGVAPVAPVPAPEEVPVVSKIQVKKKSKGYVFSIDRGGDASAPAASASVPEPAPVPPPPAPEPASVAPPSVSNVTSNAPVAEPAPAAPETPPALAETPPATPVPESAPPRSPVPPVGKKKRVVKKVVKKVRKKVVKSTPPPAPEPPPSAPVEPAPTLAPAPVESAAISESHDPEMMEDTEFSQQEVQQAVEVTAKGRGGQRGTYVFGMKPAAPEAEAPAPETSAAPGPVPAPVPGSAPDVPAPEPEPTPAAPASAPAPKVRPAGAPKTRGNYAFGASKSEPAAPPRAETPAPAPLPAPAAPASTPAAPGAPAPAPVPAAHDVVPAQAEPPPAPQPAAPVAQPQPATLAPTTLASAPVASIYPPAPTAEKGESEEDELLRLLYELGATAFEMGVVIPEQDQLSLRVQNARAEWKSARDEDCEADDEFRTAETVFDCLQGMNLIIATKIGCRKAYRELAAAYRGLGKGFIGAQMVVPGRETQWARAAELLASVGYNEQKIVTRKKGRPLQTPDQFLEGAAPAAPEPAPAPQPAAPAPAPIPAPQPAVPAATPAPVKAAEATDGEDEEDADDEGYDFGAIFNRKNLPLIGFGLLGLFWIYFLLLR